MLTVEYNSQLNRVEIRANKKGLRFLRKQLKRAQKSKEEIRIEGQLADEKIGQDTVLAKEALISYHKPKKAEKAGE
jgi:hypothetical protein